MYARLVAYEVQVVNEVRVLRDGEPCGAIDGPPGAPAAGLARAASGAAAAHARGGGSLAQGARRLGPHQPARRAVGAAALARRRRRPGAGRRPRDAGARPRRPGRPRPGRASWRRASPGDWLATERGRHRERSSRNLAAAASALEADGDLPGAAAQARERVDRDPFSESAVRELVRFTWLAGDRTAALDIYDRFRERLRLERGVAPSPETRRLVDELRAGAAGPERMPQVPLPPLLDRVATSPLIGRAEELDRRARRVRAHPPGRHRSAADRGRARHRQDAARGRAGVGDVVGGRRGARRAGHRGRAGAVPGVGRGAVRLPGGAAARRGGRADGPGRAGARAHAPRGAGGAGAGRGSLPPARGGRRACSPRSATAGRRCWCSTTCTGRSAPA